MRKIQPQGLEALRSRSGSVVCDPRRARVRNSHKRDNPGDGVIAGAVGQCKFPGMSNIERSNSPRPHTVAELRSKVRESQTFWQSPAGIAEKRNLAAAARSHPKSDKFPEIAKRSGTRPAIGGTHAVKNAIRRLNLISRI